jgi:hypothetical protein
MVVAMPPISSFGGIVLTSREWFEKCLERNCTVFHFPPNKKPNIRVLSPGSVCMVLVKEGSSRKDWLFVGELTVKSVKLVKGEEFPAYAPRAVELPNALFPKPGESSWIIVFERLIKYERPVKLGDCTDIIVRNKPLSEQAITGFTILKLDIAIRVINAVRTKAGYKPTTPQPPAETKPSHDDLVRELLELGEWLGFVVKKEEYTPDKLYRIDVVWTDAEGHAPLKAFEVEISGNVDNALARLTHTYDMWHCEQLWLVVSDEAEAERAKKLVEPRLKGSFAKIKEKVKILGWKELHDMYNGIKSHSELIKELSKR